MNGHRNKQRLTVGLILFVASMAIYTVGEPVVNPKKSSSSFLSTQSTTNPSHQMNTRK
jgi:hypothetical protein